MAVQCCLEKNPANRYATIAELAEALAPFGNARSALSVERIVHVLSTKDAAPLNATRQRDFGAVGARSSQPQVPHGMTHAQWTQSTAAGETVVEGRTKVRRATMMAAVIGASALVGMALAMMSRHSSSNDAPPPVAATAPAPSAPSVAPPAPPAEPGNALPPSTGSPVPVASATPPERPPPVRPPPVAPPPRPAALPARALPPAHTAAASSGNCQLVSYPDSDGNMRFRKECK
jgi:hypothetical protein